MFRRNAGVKKKQQELEWWKSCGKLCQLDAFHEINDTVCMIILKTVSYINLEKNSLIKIRADSSDCCKTLQCMWKVVWEGSENSAADKKKKTKQRRHFHRKVIRLFIGEKGDSDGTVREGDKGKTEEGRE